MFTGVSSQLSVFQAEKDTRLLTPPAASAGDWHSSNTSVLEIFMERVEGKTTEWLLLMSEQHLMKCKSVFFVSACWMCLGENGCDCAGIYFSVSWEFAVTLRTHHCSFQSAQLCVGVLEMQVEHHVGEKLYGFHILWNVCSMNHVVLTHNRWGRFSGWKRKRFLLRVCENEEMQRFIAGPDSHCEALLHSIYPSLLMTNERLLVQCIWADSIGRWHTRWAVRQHVNYCWQD